VWVVGGGVSGFDAADTGLSDLVVSAGPVNLFFAH
jgi:hypothetical protein